MKPSADICRAEQARHLSLAASSTLPNVRNIATLAAAAWAKEAVDADKRDIRAALRKQEIDRATLMLRLELPTQDDRRFSENPDRGFADAGAIRV